MSRGRPRPCGVMDVHDSSSWSAAGGGERGLAPARSMLSRIRVRRHGDARPRGGDAGARSSRRRRLPTTSVPDWPSQLHDCGVIGIVATGMILLWVLWDLWSSSADPFRDCQQRLLLRPPTRAMFHGHLWWQWVLGDRGVRARWADLYVFRYFPSLIRMPVLLLTSSWDGALTAPSMLLAWMMTHSSAH